MANKISVTILTKDSSTYIYECLDALCAFDEVIILDNGSTDDTLDIASSFENVKIYTSPFIGFGPLKNLAISYTSNDWVLSVDSDEIFTQELVYEIRHKALDDNVVYAIKRQNYFNHKLMDCCGWGNDYVNRLFHKDKTHFNTKQVHESLILHDTMQVSRLSHMFKHYSSDSIAQLLGKMDKYSTLYAKEQQGLKQASVGAAVFRSMFALMKHYIFQRGFLHGKEGLIVSVSNANGVFYKYMKLVEEHKNIVVSLIITTYNRPDALETVLLSVMKQTILPFEVIIADDGSDERTAVMLEKISRKSPIPIAHIWQEDEGFRAALSRNNAIRKAKGDYLILIDGDMILHPSFIEDHLKVARKNSFVQGSRVLLSKEKTSHVISEKMSQFSFFEQGIKNRKNAIRCSLLSRCYIAQKKLFEGIRTCNFALYKEDAFKVNGFDEMFVGWGREDAEFAIRLMNAGVKRRDIRFSAIAYHLYHRESSRDTLPQNDTLLRKTIEMKKDYCERGLVCG